MTAHRPSTRGTAAPAPTPDQDIPTPAEAAAAGGIVTGRPLAWLRAEGLAVAVTALAVFAGTGYAWWLVPALFLVPDLSWLGYLAGPKAGAWIYNLVHSTPLSLALLGAGALPHAGALAAAGAIGLFHLGLDRLMRYGLKYDHGFAVTHLGAHGHH